MSHSGLAVQLVTDSGQECKACLIWKSSDNFFRNSKSGNGLRKRCKDCEQSQTRLCALNVNARRWRKANPERLLLQSAKRRAKEIGLPFDLHLEDVIIPDSCPVLHIILMVGVGASTDASPTLDRIIHHLGYVHGNVAVVSQKANRLKGDATADQHRLTADWIDSKLRNK